MYQLGFVFRAGVLIADVNESAEISTCDSAMNCTFGTTESRAERDIANDDSRIDHVNVRISVETLIFLCSGLVCFEDVETCDRHVFVAGNLSINGGSFELHRHNDDVGRTLCGLSEPDTSIGFVDTTLRDNRRPDR
jgi:hypothetical protein